MYAKYFEYLLHSTDKAENKDQYNKHIEFVSKIIRLYQLFFLNLKVYNYLFLKVGTVI